MGLARGPSPSRRLGTSTPTTLSDSRTTWPFACLLTVVEPKFGGMVFCNVAGKDEPFTTSGLQLAQTPRLTWIRLCAPLFFATNGKRVMSVQRKSDANTTGLAQHDETLTTNRGVHGSRHRLFFSKKKKGISQSHIAQKTKKRRLTSRRGRPNRVRGHQSRGGRRLATPPTKWRRPWHRRRQASCSTGASIPRMQNATRCAALHVHGQGSARVSSSTSPLSRCKRRELTNARATEHVNIPVQHNLHV